MAHDTESPKRPQAEVILDANSAQPPVARKSPHTTSIHGQVLADDYFWLREKSKPEVAEYLEAENAYTDAVMAPTRPLQQALYSEMLAHIKETDESAPYPSRGYWYYSRTEKGKQYPIMCRRRGQEWAGAAEEEISLDVNTLAEGEDFMSLGAYEVSDDSSLLAYSTDNTGFRQYTLHLKDLHTGKTLHDSVPKTGSIAWANDSRTLFYTVEDHAKRQYRLYRHVLGEDSANDVLVYEEPDEAFGLGIAKSRSGKYLLLEIGSHTTCEVRYLDAGTPQGEFTQVAARIHNEEYYVDHRPGNDGDGSMDLFYIRSNRDGRNFSIFAAHVGDSDRRQWKTLVPHRPSVMVENLDAFQDFIVLTEREDGLPEFSVLNLATGRIERVKFPESVYNASSGANAEFVTDRFRFNYDSPITPRSVYEYIVRENRAEVVKQFEVPNFDRTRYALERVYATAPDGEKVPVTVFYRKDVKRDGSAPLYLYGYGSYGYPLPVNFSANRLPLLDRGIVIALAHIRGGGDLGKPWHDSGRMSQKMNTFTDFIAAAEYLIENKFADPRRIAIEGRSAGGLLMGAVTNMRTELWRAVVTGVPFVDVLNTMLDASLPLTVGEYEEWGNPNEKPAFDYMRAYSPYDNLEAKKYPAILVQTSFNDSQVMYWEPAKYVAKLRTLNTGNNPLLLKTNMAAGHGGASGRYDYLHEQAFTWAFVLAQLGVPSLGKI